MMFQKKAIFKSILDRSILVVKNNIRVYLFIFQLAVWRYELPSSLSMRVCSTEHIMDDKTREELAHKEEEN